MTIMSVNEENESIEMSQKMLISVVIPVYNVKPYLEQCLKSVVSQSYRNLDIIIIDDGSTDGSENICSCYAMDDARIRCVHQKNMGLSGARNTGIDLSRGEYITFIDSDDFIEDDMIEKLIQYIRPGVDILSCGFMYCDENGKKLSEECSSKIQMLSGEKQMEGLFYNRFCTTAAWGKIYKKSLFRAIRYPVGKYHEDVFTTYKLLDISQGMIILNEALYWYRQNSNSIMHQKFSLAHLHGIEGSLERERFVSANYPHLKNAAKASVVYSCCRCSERMILSDYRDPAIEKGIKGLIRKNLLVFVIWGSNSPKTKAFALLNAVSVTALRLIYKVYSHIG